MTQFTISVNFRDTDIFASHDDNVVWNTKSNVGAVDWIIALIIQLRLKHNLLIGRGSSERAIFDLGSADPRDEERTRIIRGRNLLTGEPASLEISSIQVRDYCHFSSLILDLKNIFHPIELPEEYQTSFGVPRALKASLIEHPIILTGEFGTLKRLREALEEVLELPIVHGDDAGLRPGTGQIGQ